MSEKVRGGFMKIEEFMDAEAGTSQQGPLHDDGTARCTMASMVESLASLPGNAAIPAVRRAALSAGAAHGSPHRADGA